MFFLKSDTYFCIAARNTIEFFGERVFLCAKVIYSLIFRKKYINSRINSVQKRRKVLKHNALQRSADFPKF